MGNKPSAPQKEEIPVVNQPPIIEEQPPPINDIPATHNDDDDEYTAMVGPFGIEPKHLFMVASVPFAMGAYSGFRKQLKEEEKNKQRAARRKAAGKPPSFKMTADSRIIGARALGVATMLSLGGFAAIGAVSFYASGYRSFDEAFRAFRGWGRKRRAELEDWHGINLSRNHPDMIATQNMSEEEEWEYVKEKYLADETILTKPKDGDDVFFTTPEESITPKRT